MNENRAGGPTPARPNVPGHRRSDPETSRQADAMAPVHRLSVYAGALAHYQAAGRQGLTADDVSALMPEVHPPTVGRRVTQLAADGLIRDSGRLRRTRRGANAVVWVIAEPEEPALVPAQLPLPIVPASTAAALYGRPA